MTLSDKMKQWADLTKAAEVLADEIKAEVAELGKSVNVGACKVTYTKGRKSYDYRTACKDVPEEVIEAYSKKTVDYRALCKGEDITDVPYTQSEPSVSVKLIADTTFDKATPFPKG